MALTKVASDGIEALAITNAHLHTVANIAHSKLADSGASAGSYGSSTAIPSITVNAKGTITSISQTSIDTDLLADTTPQLGGNLDVNGKNITFGDSSGSSDDRLTFGASADLQIYHSGSHSFIDDTGTGNLKLRSNNFRVSNADESKVSATFQAAGAAELYHNNSKKLETKSDGVLITGELEASSLDINGNADISGNLAISGTVDGADVAAMNTKLAGIESGATADQSNSEIKTAYEANSNTNAFTDALLSKLNGIEASATADQSNSEIKTAYEANSDTNAFTDALLSKLNGIAASATNVTNNNQLTNGAGYITSASLAGVSDGGNAALLDGVDSTSFCRSDQDDSLTGIISLESNSQYPLTIDGNHSGKIALKGAANPYVAFFESATRKAYIQWNSGGYLDIHNEEASDSLKLANGSLGLIWRYGGNDQTVWHAGNDGSGSGLDADVLDGVQGSSYARSDADDTLSGVITLSSSSRDALNFSANSNDDNRGVAFNGRIAISADYDDGYLRLNNASEFSNGVYTPLRMRADGGFRVSGTDVINSSGQLIASRLTGALPAIDGSALTGVGGGVESGTVMLFYQANAPTGWTKKTNQNNKALRVVSGTGGGTGGGNNFTTAFNSSRGTSGGSVSNHTLTESQIPSHRHRVDTYNEWSTSYGSYTTQGGYRQAHRGGTRYPPYTQNIGSGNAHNHGFSNPSINLNVQYIDVIICEKD